MIIPKILINQVANSLTKHFKLDKIMNYVFDKNPLDEQMEMVLVRLQKLEDISHPKKEFVRCKQCEERITEAGKLMQSIGDETI